MRIAEIAPPWIPVPPKGYGGIELVVDLLAQGFEAHGHDVTLFAPEGSRSAAEVVSPLPAAGSDSIGDRWHEAYHSVSAYQHADDFELIHDHTFLGPALARCDGGPITVHTLHGPWDDESRAYYGLLDDRVHFVAISETQRRANQDVRYAATIPNGIDVGRYPLHEGERDDFLVYIGRANAEKAPEVAVEVAHRALTGFLRQELDELVTCIERAGTISPLACRARVEEYFSAETMVDRYLQLFHALLGDRTDG
jgi:glycosyltransferase involved in cell wall biosynthesis